MTVFFLPSALSSLQRITRSFVRPEIEFGVSLCLLENVLPHSREDLQLRLWWFSLPPLPTSMLVTARPSYSAAPTRGHWQASPGDKAEYNADRHGINATPKIQ
ncbi:uncharacterized protein H6S33_002765 [Morchella sextelata]|uniref:uncharacterized protein n=1 Tax=Morchella sextelata TaxID=1174677 RepID=UPI001D05257A|nr:uncharacterized protein H6S33_002765 [Morchella sextelata]KAH0607731.1 hypothetical protein H6S33_002765 [Morchella sextelata]